MAKPKLNRGGIRPGVYSSSEMSAARKEARRLNRNDRMYQLAEGARLRKQLKEAEAKVAAGPKPQLCLACGAMLLSDATCPHCGSQGDA